MTITEHIDHIDGLLSSGQPTSVVRNQLFVFREIAEAFVLRLDALEAESQNNPLRAETDSLKEQLNAAMRENAGMKEALRLWNEAEQHKPTDIGGGLRSNAIS